jgi:hypothetical protein
MPTVYVVGATFIYDALCSMDFFYIFTLLYCFSRASAIVVVRFILHSELIRKMISVGCIYTCIADFWTGLGSIACGDLVSFENFNYLPAFVSGLNTSF